MQPPGIRSYTPAGAVDTPVLSAGAARLGYPLLERFTRAEHANRRVAQREAFLLRERLDWSTSYFNRLERLGVLGLQRGR